MFKGMHPVQGCRDVAGAAVIGYLGVRMQPLQSQSIHSNQLKGLSTPFKWPRACGMKQYAKRIIFSVTLTGHEN